MTGTAVTLEPTHEEVAANRHAWLAALRSGNYRQARRALRTHEGFCCLGVAEDVLDCDWLSIAQYDACGTHLAAHGDPSGVRDTSLTSLTWTAMTRLGLVQVAPTVVVYQRHAARPYLTGWSYTTLVGLNDTYRLSLAAIADVVELQGENWDGSVDRAKRLAARWTDERREPDPRLVVDFRESV